mmetsp:Transcript_13271/g.19092  ORF Transcript_13271/g.19092 Transcript_13271/m.19092 type:complete len:132 (+) Transcript_13271:692-1087(+)
MPIASTDDLILTSLQEIHHTLKNSNTLAPVSTFTNNNVNKLQQINEILTNVNQERRPAEPSQTAPPAYEQTVQCDEPKTPQIPIIELIQPYPAPPLRVPLNKPMIGENSNSPTPYEGASNKSSTTTTKQYS